MCPGSCLGIWSRNLVLMCTGLSSQNVASCELQVGKLYKLMALVPFMQDYIAEIAH